LSPPRLFLAGTAHADVLHLYNWNNYISDATVARFEQFCHCKLVQGLLLGQRGKCSPNWPGASGYDLIVPTGNAVESLIKSQQLRPLNRQLLPNLKNIDRPISTPAFRSGQPLFVPYAYTITLIGYNEQKMREPGVPPTPGRSFSIRNIWRG